MSLNKVAGNRREERIESFCGHLAAHRSSRAVLNVDAVRSRSTLDWTAYSQHPTVESKRPSNTRGQRYSSAFAPTRRYTLELSAVS
jgi:hypothetical protein